MKIKKKYAYIINMNNLKTDKATIRKRRKKNTSSRYNKKVRKNRTKRRKNRKRLYGGMPEKKDFSKELANKQNVALTLKNNDIREETMLLISSMFSVVGDKFLECEANERYQSTTRILSELEEIIRMYNMSLNEKQIDKIGENIIHLFLKNPDSEYERYKRIKQKTKDTLERLAESHKDNTVTASYTEIIKNIEEIDKDLKITYGPRLDNIPIMIKYALYLRRCYEKSRKKTEHDIRGPEVAKDETSATADELVEAERKRLVEAEKKDLAAAKEAERESRSVAAEERAGKGRRVKLLKESKKCEEKISYLCEFLRCNISTVDGGDKGNETKLLTFLTDNICIYEDTGYTPIFEGEKKLTEQFLTSMEAINYKILNIDTLTIDNVTDSNNPEIVIENTDKNDYSKILSLYSFIIAKKMNNFIKYYIQIIQLISQHFINNGIKYKDIDAGGILSGNKASIITEQYATETEEKRDLRKSELEIKLNQKSQIFAKYLENLLKLKTFNIDRSSDSSRVDKHFPLKWEPGSVYGKQYLYKYFKYEEQSNSIILSEDVMKTYFSGNRDIFVVKEIKIKEVNKQSPQVGEEVSIYKYYFGTPDPLKILTEALGQRSKNIETIQVTYCSLKELETYTPALFLEENVFNVESKIYAIVKTETERDKQEYIKEIISAYVSKDSRKLVCWKYGDLNGRPPSNFVTMKDIRLYYVNKFLEEKRAKIISIDGLTPECSRKLKDHLTKNLDILKPHTLSTYLGNSKKKYNGEMITNSPNFLTEKKNKDYSIEVNRIKEYYANIQSYKLGCFTNESFSVTDDFTGLFCNYSAANARNLLSAVRNIYQSIFGLSSINMGVVEIEEQKDMLENNIKALILPYERPDRNPEEEDEEEESILDSVLDIYSIESADDSDFLNSNKQMIYYIFFYN